MSTDYEAICTICAKSHHAGQRMAGKFSLGFGTGDTAGVAKLERFIDEHTDCCDGIISIVNSDAVSSFYEDVTVYSYMEEEKADGPNSQET